MDLTKHQSFFNPIELRSKEINIIGVGAVGSWIAIQLAKLGIEKLTIWDFDTVDDHNITNQVYTQNDLKKLKVDALEEHLLANNPTMKIIKKGKYTNEILKGIVFLEVDSVELRHKIATDNMYNAYLDLVIDGRIGLSTGIVYCINWKNSKDVENYISLCDFKDSESDAPVSACGTTLSVSPSVLTTAAYAVSTLINYAKGEETCKIVSFDAFSFKTRGMK